MAPAIPSHDYYSVLEVLPSANHEEIKTSYRRLARLHHPDKNCGSRSATLKIQLINAAWDVLGDSRKRREYDVRTRKQASASAGSQSNAWKPMTTSQSSTTAQDDARARAESQRKRQEWLNWERIQEQSVRQCRKQVLTLEAEIAALNAKIEANRSELANDIPYWWNVLASLSVRLSEEEKNELRRQILNSDAAIRIKQLALDREQSRLQQLEDELSRRRNQENTRVEAERREKERRERLAREKAEAEAWRRHMEEHAKQEAARKAKEKAAKEEAAKAEAARQKKVAEERAAREAAAKKRHEEAVRFAKAENERLRKLSKKQTVENKKNAKRHQTRDPSSCLHKIWWDEIRGCYDCAHCTRSLPRFAYQCPGCKIIACASCRGGN